MRLLGKELTLLFSLKDLMGYAANGKDFSGKVRDLFVDADTWLIRHLLLDVGGWLEAKTAFVAAECISRVEATERAIKLTLSTQDASSPNDVEYERKSNATELPRMLTGDAAEKGAARTTVRADSDGRMFRFSQMNNAIATHNGEKIGQIADLLCNKSDLTVSHVAIDTGAVVPEKRRILPVAHVASIDTFDDDASRVVLHVNKDRLEKGPMLKDIGELDRHWLDKIAAYYVDP